MLVDVKDTKFVRDSSSMVLINNDFSAREEYILKSKLIKSQKDEINKINTEISDIRSDILDVKKLLIQLLEGRNG
jgi:hypothetical protein